MSPYTFRVEETYTSKAHKTIDNGMSEQTHSRHKFKNQALKRLNEWNNLIVIGEWDRVIGGHKDGWRESKSGHYWDSPAEDESSKKAVGDML